MVLFVLVVMMVVVPHKCIQKELSVLLSLSASNTERSIVLSPEAHGRVGGVAQCLSWHVYNNESRRPVSSSLSPPLVWQQYILLLHERPLQGRSKKKKKESRVMQYLL